MSVGFAVDTFPGGLSYAKLSQILTDAGYVGLALEQDNGTGQSTKRLPMVTSARNLAVGLSTKLIDYQFNAAAQNTAILRHLFTTMTMTQSVGALLCNANSTLTATTGCMLTTWRQINFPGNGVVRLEFAVNFTAAPLANQVFLCGFFPQVSATAAPTDGVYFRYTNAGLQGVVNFNGVETASAVYTTTITPGVNYTFKMDISNGAVDFWNNGQLLGTLSAAAANGSPCAWGALPVSIQQYNSGTISGSPVMQTKIANFTVTQRDLATEKLWETQQALSGLQASQGAEGGTMGSTALLSNSLAAGAGAAMTNTTAALGSGLGGQFTAQPTLAAGTDGVMCSYQNPVGTINQIPRTLVIKGVSIVGACTAAITGGPLLFAHSLAYGHTAVSLATAESASFATATTKAARRIALGMDAYVITTPAGTLGQQINVAFAVPIVVNPGEFVAICTKQLGTVSSAGTITWFVRFDAHWE
jgi:hypothetical protein